MERHEQALPSRFELLGGSRLSEENIEFVRKLILVPVARSLKKNVPLPSSVSSQPGISSPGAGISSALLIFQRHFSMVFLRGKGVNPSIFPR